MIEGEEACDDGNLTADDGCSPQCTLDNGYTCSGAPSVCKTTCGDGAAAGMEECDDGNNKSGDGCSPTCTFEATCGNHLVEPGESCDDGDATGGDGCSAQCQIEPGSVCGDAVNLDDHTLVTKSGEVTTYHGTTAGVTNTTFGDAPTCSAGTTGVPRVVHRYRTGAVPSVLSAVTADAGGPMLDTVIWAFADCQSASPELTCAEDSASSLLASAHLGYFPAGSTVYVVVSGYTSLDVGPYELRVTETPVFYQVKAGTCSLPGFINAGTFAGVTLPTDGHFASASSACPGAAPDAVSVLHLQKKADVSLSVASSDINRDLVVSLSRAPCLTGTEVTCADAHGAGGQESLSVADLAAGTYYVIVGGYGAADVGPYSLSVAVTDILGEGAACDPASKTTRCATGTLCHAGACAAPTTLLTANFSAGLAPFTVGDAGSDGQTWAACDPANGCGWDNTTTANVLDPYALVRDLPSVSLDGEALTSPVLNASALSQVFVAMDHAFEHAGASADLGVVEVSTDNSSWTTAASYTADAAGHAVIDISTVAAGHATFWVRFRYDDQTSTTADPFANGWSVDNVQVYGF